MYMYVCVLHVWIHCMCIFCMTAVSVAPPPLISGVSNMSNYLTLELHRAQFLFSKKLLGMATIPLYSIRHSTKVPVHLHVGKKWHTCTCSWPRELWFSIYSCTSTCESWRWVLNTLLLSMPFLILPWYSSTLPLLFLSLSYLDTLPPSLSSRQDSEGHWIFLFLQNPSGELVPTQHQLHLDTHFELPKGTHLHVHVHYLGGLCSNLPVLCYASNSWKRSYYMLPV